MRMKDFEMIRFGRSLMIASTLSLMALAGCGTTTSDRAISGGLLGAAGGAAIGAATGNAGTGALIGGAAGAATGAMTSPDQVNLGNPVWRTCTRRDANGKCIAGRN